MSGSFSVYRGPKRHLIAVGKSAENGTWQVMKGIEGKKLKAISVPERFDVTFSALVNSHVPESYCRLFDGRIDKFGRCCEATSTVVYWSAQGINAQALRTSLRELLQNPHLLSLDVPIVEDMTGTTITIDHQPFGVTRHPTVGCISFDGQGAGTLHADTCADLLALIALSSVDQDVEFSDHSGVRLTPRQVLDRCAPHTTDALSAVITEKGYAPLSLSLRGTQSKHISF